MAKRARAKVKKSAVKKFVFVVGGVMSGVGKGVATSSIATILQSKGYEVTAMKIDPYVNVDAGTMNPTEHGEVFVLDDGMECDQDLGNYERFLNRSLSRTNYMTTGSLYKDVIERERNLGYDGKCVSVVPHVPLEVIAKIKNALTKNKAEIIAVEVGGTVGEYQNILFLEAIRMLKFERPDDVLLVLVSYLPHQGDDSEPKTKPTQYAARTLNSAGLQPDIILARANNALDSKRKEKIAFNCNMRAKDIISAPNVDNIYDIPINFERDHLSDVIFEKLKIAPRQKDLKEWRAFVGGARRAKKTVKVGIVGKYFASGSFTLADSYISVIEAVRHASFASGARPEITWLSAEEFEKDPAALSILSTFDGIVVPGGFGGRGVEGKIAAIEYCRKQKIPFFGLCYGMQLATIEFARHVAGLKDANTTEVNPQTQHPVIDIMPEQKTNLAQKNYGATMRLGAYPAILKKGTRAAESYGKRIISERHRHRYEVNPAYVERLEKKGIVFSGRSPDGRLMEIVELPREKHPFFVGTQFHPEFLSRPMYPHPLFKAFIAAAIGSKKREVKSKVVSFPQPVVSPSNPRRESRKSRR